MAGIWFVWKKNNVGEKKSIEQFKSSGQWAEQKETKIKHTLKQEEG